ncbi:MAG: hypothetical protein MHM6MM_000997 [Cercozoa sp. M6MM]
MHLLACTVAQTWADRENTCPVCRSRFGTLETVSNLPHFLSTGQTVELEPVSATEVGNAPTNSEEEGSSIAARVRSRRKRRRERPAESDDDKEPPRARRRISHIETRDQRGPGLPISPLLLMLLGAIGGGFGAENDEDELGEMFHMMRLFNFLQTAERPPPPARGRPETPPRVSTQEPRAAHSQPLRSPVRVALRPPVAAPPAVLPSDTQPLHPQVPPPAMMRLNVQRHSVPQEVHRALLHAPSAAMRHQVQLPDGRTLTYHMRVHPPQVRRNSRDGEVQMVRQFSFSTVPGGMPPYIPGVTPPQNSDQQPPQPQQPQQPPNRPNQRGRRR